MAAMPERTTVPLPCDRTEEWSDTQKFLLLLSQSKCTEDLSTLISSAGARKDQGMSGRDCLLRGLHRFLKVHCSSKEQSTFFTVVLPGICRLASQLPAFCPAEGIPFIRAQEEVTVYMSKKLVASLLANCFLCTFHKETPAKGDIPSFTFEYFFEPLLEHSVFENSQVARLKCLLVYFEKIALKRLKLTGYVKIQRKALSPSDTPTVERWLRSKKPLCSLQLEPEKKIEDCGAHTLQVDFANSCIGGGTLHSGCVQEEIRFTLCPELIVSMLIMEQMDSNEAIVMRGFERCSNYRGYGSSFAFTGECYDDSQRDELGAPMSCLVAIDAQMVGEPWEQYSKGSVLRELNKAFIGFICPENQGDLNRENLSFLGGKAVVVISSPSCVHGHSRESTPPTGGVQRNGAWNGGDIPLAGTEREGFHEFSIAVPHVGASPSMPAGEGTAPSDLLAGFSQSIATDIVQSAVHHSASAESTASNGSASLEGIGEKQSPDHSTPPEEARRSSTVQFALDPKGGLESEASMASTVSQIGSDPDPSAISTASRYSSRSSSLTGQPLIIGEYAELLSRTIVSEVESSLATDEDEEEEDERGGEEESDSGKAQSTAGPDSAVSVPSLLLPVHEHVPTQAEPSEPRDFASQLSQRLIQAAVQRPTPKAVTTPVRAGSHPLFMDRLKGPVSLDSGRHSAKWSNAPTMDQDSSPPSPAELDAMAMDYASDISEYANLLVFKCLADTIRSLTGHEMNECFDDGRQSGGEELSEEPTSLPRPRAPPSQWAEFRNALLRSVVTGNWGCGMFGGDPQLKALVQWMAVSCSDRPEIVYCTFHDRRLEMLPQIVKLVEERGMNVGQLAKVTMKCCEALSHPRHHHGNSDNNRLFSKLIQELS